MSSELDVECSACGDIFSTHVSSLEVLFSSSYELSSGEEICPSCAVWKPEVRTNRSLDENNDDLQNLKSKLAFLRLRPANEPTDDLQKCDVVIVVQGRTKQPLRAHSFILSSKSHVFHTMLNIKMSEEATGIVHIDDATRPVVCAMIKFCYNAEIDFTEEVTAEEVLEVAHKYQIDLLQAISEQHLIRTLNNSNLSKRLRLAKKFGATGLAAVAKKYLKYYFDEIIDDVLTELC